jgi:hypothetical protein
MILAQGFFLSHVFLGSRGLRMEMMGQSRSLRGWFLPVSGPQREQGVRVRKPSGQNSAMDEVRFREFQASRRQGLSPLGPLVSSPVKWVR